MKKAKFIVAWPSASGPMAARHLEHRISAKDIRLDKAARARDRTIHVAFGGEMHHRIRLELFKDGFYGVLVANIGVSEPIAWIAAHSAERIEIAGVCQFV